MSIVNIICTGTDDILHLQWLEQVTAEVVLWLKSPTPITKEMYTRALSLLHKKVIALDDEAAEIGKRRSLLQQQLRSPLITKDEYARLDLELNTLTNTYMDTSPAHFDVLAKDVSIKVFESDLKLMAALTSAVAESENLHYEQRLFVIESTAKYVCDTVNICRTLNIAVELHSRAITEGTAPKLREFINALDLDLSRSLASIENGNGPVGMLADEFFMKPKANVKKGKR